MLLFSKAPFLQLPLALPLQGTERPLPINRECVCAFLRRGTESLRRDFRARGSWTATLLPPHAARTLCLRGLWVPPHGGQVRWGGGWRSPGAHPGV